MVPMAGLIDFPTSITISSDKTVTSPLIQSTSTCVHPTPYVK